jgi:hypothetical protein
LLFGLDVVMCDVGVPVARELGEALLVAETQHRESARAASERGRDDLIEELRVARGVRGIGESIVFVDVA